MKECCQPSWGWPHNLLITSWTLMPMKENSFQLEKTPFFWKNLDTREAKCPGPSCSKLMMSLVNVSLKLWSLNMANMLNFCGKNVSSFCIFKSYSHFFSKNICELDIVLSRTVNILTTNELVKLTMLWTTGPRCIHSPSIVLFTISLNLQFILP